MPAASSWRQVGHGVMLLAVGFLDSWTAAKAKISVPGIAVRPPACLGGKREDLRGEGGCLGARWDGGLWRWFDEAKGGRPRLGGSFELLDCYRLHGQEVDHKGGAVRDTAIAV